jgi:hypothetical protein
MIPQVGLFTTLNGVTTAGDKSANYPMSRLKMFSLGATFMFLYQWIPAYFFTVLQSVAVLCLLTKNRTARFLGSAGPNTGVGVLAFTFDWTIGGAE